jgi:cellulose synthase (UDP-forming)
VSWIDAFYSPVPSLLISAGLLAVVCFLAWRGTGRKVALAICILLFARYMLWRGLYTLNLQDGLSIGISVVLFLAETYGFVQFLLFSYQAWSPMDRESPPIETYPSVDIMIPVVDEPLYILKRTLVGCLAQDYPSDLLRVYVLDDGQREEVNSLAAELGVSYLSRAERVNAKAGNLNEALKRSSGELVAVFDVDHVPYPNFLKRTVGFFADEDVAFVQTAQDFYNPDIFQRSVAPGRTVHNEQDLFFQTLQSGRDRHNSAFFAGSSGLLRRTALEEIGGFQVETITEDIHTSLLLHAKGHKSCYLNEALAFGLMPETFEAHTRQRARWATGTAQMLMRENPLFMRGLSLPQRLDYFGSVHYFFFGLPRIIFLIAPLSWLIFSIPALKADTGALINFFFSAYLGSILALQMVSRNTRNAFWSDVHETVMCFAVTAAAFVGLASANKSRTFEVTPKGRRSETKSYASVSAAGWHVAVFGLLIFGIANGVMQWYGPSPPAGLSISLWWASFNLVLVTAAILPAREQPQLRNFMRRSRRIPCSILDESHQTDAEILDVSESGAALRIPTPWFSLQKDVRIAFNAEEDELLTVNGTIVRQELEPTGKATIGVRFGDLDERNIRALVSKSFSSSDSHRKNATVGDGVFSSLWSLLSVLSRFRERLQPSRRLAPRLPRAKACRLEIGGTVLRGTIRDISFAGVSAIFPGRHDVGSQACALSIEDVGLTVSPIESFERSGETLVRFRVESISKGAPTWQAWHQPS